MTINKFAGLLFIVMFAMFSTSCSEDENGEYYYSPVAGNWELLAINGYDIPEFDVTELRLDYNGGGTYGYYAYPNEMGWNTTNLSWNVIADGLRDLLIMNIGYPVNGTLTFEILQIMNGDPYYGGRYCMYLADPVTGDEYVYARY